MEIIWFDYNICDSVRLSTIIYLFETFTFSFCTSKRFWAMSHGRAAANGQTLKEFLAAGPK